MLEFLLNTLHTRSPYDRTHHSHARCARSHRPNASSGPRESCYGRFEGPRLVSAQAQVMRTKVSNVEASGSLRELGDQLRGLNNSGGRAHIGLGSARGDIPRERIGLADSSCAQPRSRDGP